MRKLTMNELQSLGFEYIHEFFNTDFSVLLDEAQGQYVLALIEAAEEVEIWFKGTLKEVNNYFVYLQDTSGNDIIARGIIGNCFFNLQKDGQIYEKETFILNVINGIPENMEEKALQEFIYLHREEGREMIGDWTEMMKIVNGLLQDRYMKVK